MFINFLKIAWRNIFRKKTYSLINIAGLSIGLTSVFFILIYIKDDLKYDRFFKDADHIFQVNLNGNIGGNQFIAAGTPPPAGLALQNSFREIESFTRVFNPGNTIVHSGEKPAEKYFSENGIRAVDSNFLQVLNFELIEGNAPKTLLTPNSIVVTENMAKKYFGNENAINKILLVGNEQTPFTITGVLKNIPTYSTLQFDFLIPIASQQVVKQFSWSWVWLQVSTYVKILDSYPIDQASIQKLENKFPAMVRVQAASAFNRIGKPFDEFIKKGGHWNLELQPFTSVHLYSSGIGTRYTTLSDIKYIYIFSAIAFFIILLACVNFMNLSTAQSEKRGKEVGIRKVLGSVKAQFIKQFIGEAFVYTILSFLISIVLAALLLKPFNQLTGKEFTFGSLFNPEIFPYMIGMIIIVGLLAGSYPAFYLSSFMPVKILKSSKEQSTRGNFNIRNGLVILQFAISTIMIISTTVIYNQLRFTQNKNLGLDKENVIVIASTDRLRENEKSFRDELKKNSNVIDASITTSIPTGNLFGDGYIPQSSEKDVPSTDDITLSSFMVDENFVPTLKIELLEGRNFSSQFNDSLSVILNETAARQIGWKQAVGKNLIYPGNNNQPFKVIGIAKDFNIESLHSPMSPFALFHSTSKTYQLSNSFIIARTKPGDLENSLNIIKTSWKNYAPDIPFDYSFLDAEFDSQYRSEQKMGRVFGLFTFLSFFIACLGLFGLSAYMAEKRAKEVSIRKVLGATVSGIVAMMSRDFLKLVFISTLIAFPLAWYAMNKWLEDFAYKTTISYWIFIYAGIASLSIALITVSFQTIKAAQSNPSRNLRAE